MIWQDIFLTIAAVGFVLALIPLLITTVHPEKEVEIGLTVSAAITSTLLVVSAVAQIGLGATFGGSTTFVASFMWAVIGIFAYRNKKKS